MAVDQNNYLQAMAEDADTGKPMPKVAVTNVMEYYGKSTDTKPTTNIKKGSTFFEINTKTVYMYDGSTWVVI